jgi:hypothetical protein
MISAGGAEARLQICGSDRSALGPTSVGAVVRMISNRSIVLGVSSGTGGSVRPCPLLVRMKSGCCLTDQ